MRILTLTNLYPPHYLGGYELNCQRVTEALQSRAHEVEVLTSNHGVSEDDALSADESGIERSLRINGYFGHPWLGIRQLKDVEIHNNRVLRRKLAEYRPDLVYVWNMGGISKSLLLTLQELGIPTVLYVSDHWIARSLKGDVWMDWWNRKRPSLAARVLRWLWTLGGFRREWGKVAPTDSIESLRFHRLTFCSRALRKLTVSQGYDVAHGEVIHCHVDTERFRGAVAAADKPLRRLLYVGRLAEDKGVMCALRAMAIIKDRFPGELCIYGKGDQPYTETLHDFVALHQLPVTFHACTNAEMPEIYRRHDALLFTSEWEEPFALTPLEAMASGLPVIGTTTGGSAELFREGINALTYTAGDADMLAGAIMRLAQDSGLRTSVAAEGQRAVHALCAKAVIVDQIEAYLSDTIKHWSTWCGRDVALSPSHSQAKATGTFAPLAAA